MLFRLFGPSIVLCLLILVLGCNSRNAEYKREVAERQKEWEEEKRAERKQQEEKAREKAERLKSLCATAPYYGTTVPFVNTFDEACEKAKKENKLVFLLHLSGDFKNNDFT